MDLVRGVERRPELNGFANQHITGIRKFVGTSVENDHAVLSRYFNRTFKGGTNNGCIDEILFVLRACEFPAQ